MRGGVEVEQCGQAGTDLDLELPVWDPAKKRLQPDLSFTHPADFANLSLGLFSTAPQSLLNRKENSVTVWTGEWTFGKYSD